MGQPGSLHGVKVGVLVRRGGLDRLPTLQAKCKGHAQYPVSARGSSEVAVVVFGLSVSCS